MPTTDLDEIAVIKRTLLSASRGISEGLPRLSTWVVGGFGIGFGIVIANMDLVSRFVEIAHVRFALLVFLGSLFVAVVGSVFSTVVKVNLVVMNETDALVREIQSAGRRWDVELFFTEYKRAFFPHTRWLLEWTIAKAKAGDTLLGVRIIAKLSQLHGICVLLQCVLALIALGSLAAGLKMQ